MATRIIVKSKLFAAVIFLTAASFAAEVRFEDNGVAPSYRPYYPCLTVKDRENRIVAVLSGDECDLSRLPVDGMQAQEFVAKFMVEKLVPVPRHNLRRRERRRTLKRRSEK